MAFIKHLYNASTVLKAAESSLDGCYFIGTAGDLAKPVPALNDTARGADLLEYFHADEAPDCVAIVSDGMPVGLVSKLDFIKAGNAGESRAQFLTAPWTTWGSRQPLVADASEGIEALARRAHGCVDLGADRRVNAGADAGSSAGARLRAAALVHDAFIVTRGSRYLGLGPVAALRSVQCAVEARAEIERLAAVEVEVPIQRHAEFLARARLQASSVDHGMLHQRRAAVSGDGVFVHTLASGTFIAVVACTENARPSARMQIATLGWLNAQMRPLAAEAPFVDPAQVLAGLQRFLSSDHRSSRPVLSRMPPDSLPGLPADEGVAAGAVWLPRQGQELLFAGAGIGISLVKAQRPAVETLEQRPHLLGHPGSGTTSVGVSKAVVLDAASRLLIYTPALVAQVGGPFNEPLGHEALAHVMHRHAGLTAAAMLKALEARVAAWRGSHPQPGDLTVLALTVGPPGHRHSA